MTSQRHAVLIGIVVMLWGQPYWAHAVEPSRGPAQGTASPPAVNSISGLTVKQTDEGEWLLDFDYVFTGNPPDTALHIEVPPQPGTDLRLFHNFHTQLLPPEPGAHHVSTVIQYPGEGSSREIIVTLGSASPQGKVLASQRIDKVIQWPTQAETDFDLAVAMIDNGRQQPLREARLILERLIGQNPKLDSGYVELARLAMKTNWGPEGLHQAETLLDSALKIRADSVNAKILLGYVYAHQRRFREAEALFVDAARANPPNPWLWTNWGELLEMQGKPEQAIARYRETLARPMGALRYDGARRSAYARLLQLLEARQDVDGMEAIYKQRMSEFGPSSCFSADYARFKLNVRGDAQGAIDLARGALKLSCDDAPSRQILGLASYVKWANGGGHESTEALNQARIFLPAGPMTLCLLASSESTLPAARKLIAAGEAIDQKDNEQMTALAHALQMGKLDAVERLLRLGARPETPVGVEEMPVALLPVLTADLSAIRVLQQAGIDYSKLRYRGATALDFASQMGDEALLKALTLKARAL